MVKIIRETDAECLPASEASQKKTKDTKAPGPDGVPNSTLKAAIQRRSPPQAHQNGAKLIKGRSFP